jgi:hypothetical protein
MANYPISNRDPGQALQYSFDENTGRLKVLGLNQGTVDGTVNGTPATIKVDAQGNQSVIMVNALVPTAFDSIFATYPSATQELYTYKFNTVTVAIVTVDYTDASKNTLVSVVRT